jgi:hypothetical protein
MRIDGIENLTLDELEAGLAAGGRFVVYEYCISLIVLTRRCPTAVRYLPPTDWGVVHGLPWVLLSLLLGWWGLPWGIIYTPLTIFTNLCGGHDVTDEVWARIQGGAVASGQPAGPAE